MNHTSSFGSPEPFAVVGYAVKLPQEVEDEAGFWEMLEAKKNVMTEWPENRATVDGFYDGGFRKPNMLYSRGGHFFKEEPGVFDAPFFSITAAEAAAMDPQQRHALEASYHAFENAGIPVESIRGQDIAVFGASMTDDYSRILFKDSDTMPRQGAVGTIKAALPNRVSWYFDLHGPSVYVDTACSSGLAAMDIACQAMTSGDAKAALIVGCNLLLSPDWSLSMGNMNFLSPNSQCYSFDSRANGYARGEGVVAILVKPLREALQAGDMIRAIIRSTASNQDGQTPTFTQPSPMAQEALIRHAYTKAGLEYGETRYCEAHGTGTQTGDPIEMKAIGSVFRKYRSREEPLYVGSVKANIGHLEGASGLAGVVKVIMALERGVIPPNALFEQLNRDIDADFLNVQHKVPTKSVPWPSSGLRRASVNSFGFGGANSHIILDDSYHYLLSQGLDGHHNTSMNTAKTNGHTKNITTNGHTMANGHAIAPKLLVWSAADKSTMQRLLEAYQHYCASDFVGNRSKLNQLAYTLAARRSIMQWRSFSVVDATEAASLSASRPVRSSREKLGVAFVFTGQGAQYVSMGLELIHHYPVFKESLARSNEFLFKLGCTWSVFNEINSPERINRPEVSQPLSTLLQIALVDLLRSFGIAPVAVVGHSSGEVAAAYTVGALSHESACKVAYVRGKYAGKLAVKMANDGTPGAMLSVNLTPDQVPVYLEELGLQEGSQVHIACYNSPTNLTLSGQVEAIELLRNHLDQKGIFAHMVNTGVAYHSPVLRAVADDCMAELSNTLKPDYTHSSNPQGIIMFSTLTGREVAPKLLETPQYWVNNFTSPVRFVDALQCMVHATNTAVTDLIEIGPHAALKRPVKDSTPETMRYHSALERKKSPVQTILTLLGTLFCHGHPVSVLAGNGQKNSQGRIPFLVDCPPYPFNHSSSYWHESRLSKGYRFRKPSPGYLIGERAHDWNPLHPRWRNWLRTETSPWLGHHTVTNTIICPGAGMLVMALEAVKQTAVASNISGFRIKDAEFLAPIRVGETAQEAVETELELKPIPKAHEKDSAWSEICIFEHYNDYTTECFRARVKIEYKDALSNPVDDGLEMRLEHEQIRGHVKRSAQLCTKPVESNAFYKFCERQGLQYGEAFSLLRDIGWDEHNTSTARINLTQASKHWEPSDSPVHPAVLDAAIHLAMAQVSKGLAREIPSLVPQKLASIWISAKSWVESTSAVRLSCNVPNLSSSTIDNSVYALADDDSPLCAIEHLTMARVSRPNEPKENKKAEIDNTLLYNITWKPQLSTLNADALQQVCHDLARAGRSRGNRLHGTDKFPDSFIAASDEAAMRIFYLKMGTALRIATRRALRFRQGSDVRRDEHSYLFKYVQLLGKLYGGNEETAQEEDVGDQELEALLQECEAEQPDWPIFAAVARTLPSMFRGETDPLSLTKDTVETVYRHVFDQHMLDGRLQIFLDLASHETPGLRILEVGAGTGALTRNVLASLRGYERETGHARFSEYIYTDISAEFFETARDEFREYQSRMVFKTLDIQKNVAEEELASYDMIVVGRFLHTTSDPAAALNHVCALLKPGGYLLMQEVVSPTSPCVKIGLASLEPRWLDNEDCPLATEEDWDRLLRSTGFSGIELNLKDYESDICHFSSILVSKKEKVRVDSEPGQHPELVFFIDPDSENQRRFATEICEKQPGRTRIAHLEHVGQKDWTISPGEVVVSLLEVGTPRLASISEVEFLTLKQLIKGSQSILWVTAALSQDDMVSNTIYAAAIGLLRSIRSEDSSKHVVSLAIESCPADTEARHVLDVLESCFAAHEHMCPEQEFIVRDGHLSIGRVAQEIQLDRERVSRIVPQMRTELWKAGPHLALKVGTPGMLDTLHYIEDATYDTNDDLKPGEVEVESVAWPVSSRDVSIALGRLGDEGLGFECAGTVARSYSHEFQPGDRVVMVMEGCLRSHPRAPAQNIFKLPEELPFSDAVAAIQPGLTAYHSLVNVARLSRGDTILIHSAAGSTGQMAVAIARMLGADIFVTVDFQDEKQILTDSFNISEDHIFYSQGASFARGVMRMTANRGVDCILNCLAGEGLRASCECLAPNGRFIEIGMAVNQANSSLPMSRFPTNCTYAAVDMLHVFHTDIALTRQVVQRVLELIADRTTGISGPVPQHLYPASDIERAFRDVRSGRDTGSVIVAIRPEENVQKLVVHKSAWKFDSKASYLIGGGLGGIGRAMVRWMASKGARNLILVSRSGASSKAASSFVSELETTYSGIHIHTPRCDASSADDLSAILQDCSRTMPPIKGCINGIMNLQDSIFEKMTYAQWSATVGSKVKASWNLHRLLPADLDFFILLSSLSGIYGSVGQGNYAAGCAFQDALALARNKAGCFGRCSVSLDLGWMRTIGVIAESGLSEEYRRNRESAADSAPVEAEDLMALLEHYCDPSLSEFSSRQVLVGAITPAHFHARGEEVVATTLVDNHLFAGFDVPSVFANGSSNSTQKKDSPAVLFQLAKDPQTRSVVVMDALRAKVARALGVASDDVDPTKKPSDYGVDSLMAVELRNFIHKTFDVTIGVFEIMGGLTITEVGELAASRANVTA